MPIPENGPDAPQPQEVPQPALEDAESRYRLLMENVQDYAIIFLDPANRVVEWNTGAERILGYSEAEILGRSAACFFTPEDIRRGEPEREQRVVAAEGRAMDERWQVRKDGSRFWASGVMTPLRDPAGKLVGFAKVLRDLTERKRADEALHRAKEAAEAANHAKDELLTVVAHDLRAPLTAILGWVEVLRAAKPDEATLARALETIERNARLQAQLIEDLLDFARITTGKLHLEVRPVELVPVLEAALDTVRPEAEAKAIELRAALDPAASPVSGDPVRLQQVAWNLLANAIKFTPQGGRVEVRLGRADGQARITVRDTGVGIPPELLPHIFERFRQAEGPATGPHGGLGLGLAIVHHLVGLHGGTVRADSPGAGQGTTVTVDLPLAMRGGAGRR